MWDLEPSSRDLTSYKRFRNISDDDGGGDQNHDVDVLWQEIQKKESFKHWQDLKIKYWFCVNNAHYI